MLESAVEKQVRKWVEGKGGVFVKLLPFVQAGIPDRIAILPLGLIVFVELKAAKKKLKPAQKYWRAVLYRLGAHHVWGQSALEVIAQIEELSRHESRSRHSE